MDDKKQIQDQIDEITREVRKRLEKELLEKVKEEFHRKIEAKLREVTGRKPSAGPPDIVKELLEKLDETREVDAGIILGNVWRTKHGTNSSLSSFTGLESWMKVPDSYVEKVVQPFTDPRCLAILKAFLDGAKKTREELQEASGLGGDELEERLMKLMELRYIRCEVERLVKKGEVISRELFSIDHRYGLTLLLVLLYRADEQRKYEEG